MADVTLPAARVYVLGEAHGPALLIEAMRALHDRRLTRPLDILADSVPPSAFSFRHEFATKKRRYAFWECAHGLRSVVEASGRYIHGVLWMLSVRERVSGAQLDALEAAHFLGARHATVYLVDAHEGADAADAAESEARHALEAANFLANEALVVRSTGDFRARDRVWYDGISALCDALDEAMPYVSLRGPEQIAHVTGVSFIRRQGTTVTACIVQGSVLRAESFDLVRASGRRSLELVVSQYFGRPGEVAEGINVALVFRGLQRSAVRVGDLIVPQGSAAAFVTELDGEALVWTNEGDADPPPLQLGAIEAVVVGRAVPATITALDRVGIRSGRCAVSLQFSQPIPWYDGASLLLRNAANVAVVHKSGVC